MVYLTQISYPLTIQLRLYLFILVLGLSTSSTSAQESENYAHAANAEKIYLQLDRKLYANTDVIWFKSIVTHAVDHKPTVLS
ncbi:MAG: hypothetical protein AAF705_21670, partial [Bacteroidota bacterium]